MTTYYCYGKDGTVTTSLLDPNAQVFTRGHSSITSYEQQGDIVGAYLARRDMGYHVPTEQETYHYQAPPIKPWGRASGNSTIPEPMERSYWSSDAHESSGYPGSSRAEVVSTLGYAGSASHPSIAQYYPDPEEIRHMHTLHSLLPYLQPGRKMNALNGPKVDIFEQDTGVVLAQQVSKKLLVMFLGRRVVNKYIRTLHRENVEECSGSAACQEISLPRGKSCKAAMAVLISWMARACRYRTMNTMTQIRVPKSTFVACSLAQTMEMFELHKDALRVDHYIAQTHFTRPIFAVELEALWNCLGEANRYVYAAIKVVGKRIQDSERPGSRSVPGINYEMYAMLKRHPRLEARVRDLELNEQHRPTFSTIWTRKLGDGKNDQETNQLQGVGVGHSSATSEKSSKDLPTRDQSQSLMAAGVGDATRGFEALSIVSAVGEESVSYVGTSNEASQTERSILPCDDNEVRNGGMEEAHQPTT
ncbi:uncharacterized protein SETTUDRAFT_107690 [Exserohilum turcica Et28A]|uniref:Uncharacterized protein n=1 Tax=Exserohilum turcicum (strain 28A) TaxID=671987 RepID=R0KKA6_EXST2|nr:uncharacterized protein SETTUDRAFT_107690 [Exserohilum turcica Et28A]EOA88422.1 hypothetical protein SETTUDRAFT_107690 [Exserohilum turcica Et28A]